MIKVIFSVFLLINSNSVFSKVTSQTQSKGVAIYKQTINVHASLPKSQSALKAMIPEFQYINSKISFKNNILRFETVVPPASADGEPKIGSIRMMSSGTENKILDVNKKIITQYGNVMDIDYIVTHKISDDQQLKFTDETKTINGYACKKIIDRKTNLTIWYQENEVVIVPSESFANIPGLVVKVEGAISYELISINQDDIEGGYFDVPKNYKEISQEQFQDLQEESIEEMMSSMGMNGKMIKTEVQQ